MVHTYLEAYLQQLQSCEAFEHVRRKVCDFIPI